MCICMRKCIDDAAITMCYLRPCLTKWCSSAKGLLGPKIKGLLYQFESFILQVYYRWTDFKKHRMPFYARMYLFEENQYPRYSAFSCTYTFTFNYTELLYTRFLIKRELLYIFINARMSFGRVEIVSSFLLAFICFCFMQLYLYFSLLV